MENQEFLTIEQVAKQFQVDYTTIKRWITSGKLDALKINNTYRIAEDDLKAFIDANKTSNAVTKRS